MGFDKKIKMEEIYDLRQTNPPFPVDQGEISSERIKVVIRLSSKRNINTIRKALHQSFPDFDVDERGNNIIEVAGCPPEANFDENKILDTVKKHDSGAVKL